MSRGAAIALLLTCAGCAASQLPGELTALECDNGIDDDNDGDPDCFDADCQLFEHCRHPMNAGQGAGSGGTAGAPPIVDAGVPLGDASLRDASEPIPPPDAAIACPEMPCPVDQICNAGRCVPRPMVPGDDWIVTSIEAAVPRSARYSIADPMCIDVDCASPVTIPPYFRCGCVPDPLVRLFVDGLEVGTTEAAVNADSQRWTTSFPITVFPWSELRFDVLDRDPLTDELIYSCTVAADPTLFRMGTIGCNATFASDVGDLELGVIAGVSMPLGS